MAEFITELKNILETTHDITKPNHIVMTLGPLIFEMGSTLCEGHTETRVSLQGDYIPRTAVCSFRGNDEAGYSCNIMAVNTSYVGLYSGGKDPKTIDWIVFGTKN